MQWSMVSLVGDAEAEGGHDWDTSCFHFLDARRAPDMFLDGHAAA